MLYSDFITKSVTGFETVEGESRFQGKTVLKYSISCPKTDINLRIPSEKIINSAYARLANSTKRYIINNYYSKAVKLLCTVEQKDFVPLEIMCEMTVMYENRGFLSLFFDTYEKTGDIVLKSSRKSDTWSVRCGKILPIGCFFTMGYDYRRAIEGKIRSMIERELGEGETKYFSDWQCILSRELDMRNFYLADDGLVIYFQEYSLAPKDAGLPSFLIPYRFFGSNLKYDL